MMRILPGASALTLPYWEAAREHRLVAQRCDACSALQHPPMPRCMRCHGDAFTWAELSGRGAVYAYTIVTHPTHVAFADRVPYAVGVVETEEGLRIVSDFPGDPARIAIGVPVRVRFDEVSPTITLPRFEPAESGSDST